jgi:uncharacterized protein (TIGR02246 family)
MNRWTSGGLAGLAVAAALAMVAGAPGHGSMRRAHRAHAAGLRQGVAPGESQAASGEREIKKLLDRYAAALRAKDVKAIMALYEPGVVAFDLVPPLKYVGKADYERNYQGFLDMYNGPIEFEIRDLSITAGEDVAFSHSLQRVGGTTKAGEKTSLWLRVTSGYRKVKGQWMISHDHASVPVDLETGKALLDLKP